MFPICSSWRTPPLPLHEALRLSTWACLRIVDPSSSFLLVVVVVVAVLVSGDDLFLTRIGKE